ncbi:PucR family transcriptional regulator [Peribacillus sp. SCS-155]|uniref:PucR family transcriptional regulator n=1 Tax=Peribacillus sedimenti TaxID=3115297 RepID=UPI003906C4C9
MLQKLKIKYPGAVSSKQDADVDRYIWFSDSDSELGIPIEDISAEEIKLLQLLFDQDINITGRNLSDSKKQWFDFLYRHSDIIPLTNWDRIRMTHFSLSNSDFSYTDFEEAILAFVTPAAIILWQDERNGTLIEGYSEDILGQAEISPVMDTLESDFFLKIKLFIGQVHSITEELPWDFEMEQESFGSAAGLLPDFRISSIPEVFPYIALQNLSEKDKHWYLRKLLGDINEDSELVGTVKMYIECNSNASMAAKKLYIHRNSLQYRIDKFIEKTNLDIRTFRHALTAYLAIMLSTK